MKATSVLKYSQPFK